MISSLYEKYALPKILDCCCSTKPVNYQRNKIVPLAKGKVLEIGIGSGLNMPYYTGSSVEKIIGLDPSEELNEIALKKAKDTKLNIDFILNGAEEISLPNNSILSSTSPLIEVLTIGVLNVPGFIALILILLLM